MAKVLIIGASKGIGLATVKQALSAGHHVRAMARGADKIAFTDENLEKVSGNALDPDNVAEALDGIDVVIQALGIAPGPQMVIGPITLFSRATRVLIPAMKKARAKRLIAVTGFGAGDSEASIGCLQRVPFRLILGQAYDDKSVQEALIMESSLDWTIVRPVVLTRGRRSGRYSVLLEPRKWRNGFISRADVADFIVQQIDDDSHIGQAPVLAY